MRLEQAPHEFVPSRPGWATVFWRRFWIDPLDIVFPSDIEIRGDGFGRAEDLLEDGWGLVVLINHFSNRDPVEVLKDIIWKNPIMRGKQILGPMAYHQYSLAVNIVCKLFGVEPRPLVTAETLQRKPNVGHPLMYGSGRYITDAIIALQNGGIVLVAPQTTRKERLDIPEYPTVAYFLHHARQKKLEHVAYMLVGLGIMGVQDYSKGNVGGINLLRNYSVSIGLTLTQGELVAGAKKNNMSPDKFVYDHLAPLVPEAYRGATYRQDKLNHD